MKNLSRRREPSPKVRNCDCAPLSYSDPTENLCQGPRVRQRHGCIALDGHFFSFTSYAPGAGDATTSMARSVVFGSLYFYLTYDLRFPKGKPLL